MFEFYFIFSNYFSCSRRTSFSVLARYRKHPVYSILLILLPLLLSRVLRAVESRAVTDGTRRSESQGTNNRGRSVIESWTVSWLRPTRGGTVNFRGEGLGGQWRTFIEKGSSLGFCTLSVVFLIVFGVRGFFFCRWSYKWTCAMRNFEWVGF